MQPPFSKAIGWKSNGVRSRIIKRVGNAYQSGLVSGGEYDVRA
jgi:hypothetical protein